MGKNKLKKNNKEMDELFNFEDDPSIKQPKKKKLKSKNDNYLDDDLNEEKFNDDKLDDEQFDEDELSFDDEDLDDEDLEDEDLDDEELDDEDLETKKLNAEISRINDDDVENNELEDELENMEDEEIDEDEFNDSDDQESDLDESDDLNKNLLKNIKLNDKKIQQWSIQLKEEPTKLLLTEIVSSLKIAVKCVSGKSTKLRVEAANYFNPLLKLVLIDFIPALHKLLKLDSKIEEDRTQLRTIRPKKSQYWKKYTAIIKIYLKTMLDIVDNFTDDTILSTLLKHILDLVPFYLCYVALIKRILKNVSQLWSEGKEENRVLSFLILIRMLREQKSELINYIMKKLYISYIKNCKYTNEDNFAMINFMKQSLVELYSLDQGVAYQHAFIYIRQCAINLRTSMMSNKKEGFKTVYNWQYIHSLLLWVQTISCLHPSDVLKPLIYPLTQVLIGTIKLVPSSRYLPLRLHLIKALIKLSLSTNTYIPILPFLTEILDILERTKKYKTTPSDKTINFDVLLKVQNDFVNHNEFAELTIKYVYDLLLEYTAKQSHLISFPELVLVSNVRIKKFLKNWKNADDCKKFKLLLDKINESSKLIEMKRQNSQISVTEFDKIDTFENEIKLSVTPLMRFYESQKNKQSEKQNKDDKKKNKTIADGTDNKKNLIKNKKMKKRNEKQNKVGGKKFRFTNQNKKKFLKNKK